MASIVAMANQTADRVRDQAADRGLSRSGRPVRRCVGVDAASHHTAVADLSCAVGLPLSAQIGKPAAQPEVDINELFNNLVGAGEDRFRLADLHGFR